MNWRNELKYRKSPGIEAVIMKIFKRYYSGCIQNFNIE